MGPPQIKRWALISLIPPVHMIGSSFSAPAGSSRCCGALKESPPVVHQGPQPLHYILEQRLRLLRTPRQVGLPHHSHTNHAGWCVNSMAVLGGTTYLDGRLGSHAPAAHSMTAATARICHCVKQTYRIHVPIADFHAMARACSADEDTLHYLHVMNW